MQPDVLALPLLNGRPAERFDDVGELPLAVEVLSPPTARTVRFGANISGAVYRSTGLSIPRRGR